MLLSALTFLRHCSIYHSFLELHHLIAIMRSYTLFMYNYKDHYLFHPITVLVILGLILRSAHYLFSIILHSAVLMSAHCCQILPSTANQFVALGQCRSAAFASAYDMQSSMTSICYSIIKVNKPSLYIL